jgi:uncharacterized protein (TIGR02217 family)
MVAKGSLHGFRYRNIYDYKMEKKAVAQKGSSDALLFQLGLPFSFGSENFYKPIYKIVENSVSVYVGTAKLEEGTNGYFLDYNTGVVEILSELQGTVYITCEYDTPVRFSSDDFNIDPIVKKGDSFVSNTTIELIELMGAEIGVLSKEDEEVIYIPIEE